MSTEEDLVSEAEREEALRAQDLLRRVEFGLQCKEFLNSPFAQRIQREVDAEMLELMEALMNLDTDIDVDRMEARRIRQRASVINQWRVYFDEFIAEGEQAETQYHEGENPVELQ